MSVDYFLTRLREIFYEPPSAEGWAAICALYNKWPWDDEDGLAMGLDYTRAHLDRWPDELRRAPERWIAALLSTFTGAGRVHQGWSLVKALDLDYREIATAVWPRLLASEHLSGLARLHIKGQVPRDGLAALAASHHLAGLTHLELSYVKYLAPVLKDLCSARQFEGLTHLSLRYNDLRDQVAAFAEATSRPTFLNLTACNLTDEGLAALLRSPLVDRAAGLNLDHNAISDVGFKTLCQSPKMSALTHLRLDYNGITDEGVEALLRAPILDGLVSLNLDHNPIKERGAILIARSPRAKGLRFLGLGYSIGKNGQRALAGSRHLQERVRALYDKR